MNKRVPQMGMTYKTHVLVIIPPLYTNRFSAYRADSVIRLSTEGPRRRENATSRQQE